MANDYTYYYIYQSISKYSSKTFEITKIITGNELQQYCM